MSNLQCARLRRLVGAHVQSLNAHDLSANMAAFASHASLLTNGKLNGTPQAIAAAYTRLGFSPEPGLLSALAVSLEREHFTDEEVVYEARLRGVHTGTAPGFPPPTQAVLDLPCVLMYRFDRADRVIAKRLSVDFGPLFRGLYPAPPLPQPAAPIASRVEHERPPLERGGDLPQRRPEGSSHCDASTAQERARWRHHYDIHMGEENHHDVEGVMATFGTGAEMIFNGMPFRDAESIAEGHVLYGWSSTREGAFEGAHSITDCVFYTDDEVLAHGRFRGRHARDLLGFPGSGREIELHYAAFYRFDAEGKLVSERIVMDWSPLVAPSERARG